MSLIHIILTQKGGEMYTPSFLFYVFIIIIRSLFFHKVNPGSEILEVAHLTVIPRGAEGLP